MCDDGVRLWFVHTPNGWAFTDWVYAWKPGGVPPVGQRGACATINLQYVMVLRNIARLGEIFGERELAARCLRIADGVGTAVVRHFWVEEKRLFAENKEKNHFSEHAQCMAPLGGAPPYSGANANALLEMPGLQRTTSCFSYYLFETPRKIGRPDEIHKRMDFWFGLAGNGLRTTVERWDPTRSGCHAWGAHPMFHAYTTFAGIRPAAPGFKRVEIRPQPGPLGKIKASIGHPAGGFVTLEMAKGVGGDMHGTACVPDGISAEIVRPGGTKSWTGGMIAFQVGL